MQVGYINFEDLTIVRSVARDAYMESDHGVTFDTYSWSTLWDHETMSQFLGYKFDDHPAMFAVITQFTVCNSP